MVRIWIGGDLHRSEAHRLVLAVRAAKLSTGTPGFEDVTCRPRSIEGLMEALTPTGHLHLQGEPEQLVDIVETCRELGLAYRLWDGATLEVKGPDIAVPLRLHAPRPDLPLIEHSAVRRAISLLRAGETLGALLVLEKACPELPALQPLRLVRG